VAGEGGPEFEYRPDCGLGFRGYSHPLRKNYPWVIPEKQAVAASPKYWSTHY
jgi:hypothetical protein